MVGTSGAFRVVHKGPREFRPGLFCYLVDERRLVEGGSVSDGGNLAAWLGRTLQLDSLTPDEAAPDAHGLTFLPLLGGERSPGWNGRARGALRGLSFATTPEEILQAALEGVAYRLAEIVDLLPGVDEIVATGGALRDQPRWTQILADVLGRPLVASRVREASARGAAVLVLECLGATPSPAPLGGVVEPRQERTEIYRAARERQRRLYETLA
jgi:gluconokinase